MAPGVFQHLTLLVPDPYDCILSKLERSSGKDLPASRLSYRHLIPCPRTSANTKGARSEPIYLGQFVTGGSKAIGDVLRPVIGYSITSAHRAMLLGDTFPAT
jgi:hypothetical protein